MLMDRDALPWLALRRVGVLHDGGVREVRSPATAFLSILSAETANDLSSGR